MSWNPALDPQCPTGDEVDSIETLIIPRTRDLGGSKCGAPCLLRGVRWWVRLSFLTRWVRQNSCQPAEWMCAHIRI